MIWFGVEVSTSSLAPPPIDRPPNSPSLKPTSHDSFDDDDIEEEKNNIDVPFTINSSYQRMIQARNSSIPDKLLQTQERGLVLYRPLKFAQSETGEEEEGEREVRANKRAEPKITVVEDEMMDVD
jgi:hypothetical protein